MIFNSLRSEQESSASLSEELYARISDQEQEIKTLTDRNHSAQEKISYL